jgi:hypothetical protein
LCVIGETEFPTAVLLKNECMKESRKEKANKEEDGEKKGEIKRK